MKERGEERRGRGGLIIVLLQKRRWGGGLFREGALFERGLGGGFIEKLSMLLYAVLP